ncbi:hypothetical protein PCC7424_1796 [Gloeothece citriformis PCC 7424]|uniref:Uncharacterized protein n=1 Tax=Gloeothece citriformis (strain PCC 7424) TaxID=65393 RepID=B7KCC3_GLOC7|nr:hypothetical protein [Gloeothece citriformis]ACK70228.1 hypothetical protein PCC7424_1796 [Gloeothece citriformis PCC 7424]
MILQIICASFAWTLIGLGIWRIGQTLKEGLTHLQRIHQVPCHRCAYFTRDYRLKCTVNPVEAMTEEAINCEDFEVKSNLGRLAPVISVSSRYCQKNYCQPK